MTSTRYVFRLKSSVNVQWLPFSADDAKKALLGAICTTALLLGLWCLVQLYIVTPWYRIADTCFVAVSQSSSHTHCPTDCNMDWQFVRLIQWASQVLAYASRVVGDVIDTVIGFFARIYATITTWAIARALAALQLPPDVYERIPRE